MFVKDIRTDFDLVDVVRDEMVSGKMTTYRRNDIIDYLKRMVCKFKRRLYIPREVIAMRQLIEDLWDIEIYEEVEDVNNKMLDDNSEAITDELNVSHKDDVRHEVAIPDEEAEMLNEMEDTYEYDVTKEADISSGAEVLNETEISNEADDPTETAGYMEIPSEGEEIEMCDAEVFSDGHELEEISEAEISFEAELQLEPEIPKEADIQAAAEIQFEADIGYEYNIEAEDLPENIEFEPYAEEDILFPGIGDEIFEISFKRDPRCRGH